MHLSDIELEALTAEYFRRIGSRVAELRALQGLSLSELEELAGVHKSALSKIERGKSAISVKTAIRIAEGLGVQLHELFVPREISQVRPKRQHSKRRSAG